MRTAILFDPKMGINKVAVLVLCSAGGTFSQGGSGVWGRIAKGVGL